MIFSSLQSSSPFAWHAWLVLIAWMASIGGFVVLVGLVMEKFFEKPKYRSVTDFRKSKSRKGFGEWLVIIGVGVEIVSAIVLALRGEIENKHITTEQAALEPTNQPISDMSATAILIVMGTHFNDLTNWDARRVARMTLWKDENTMMPMDSLNAETFTRNDFMVLTGNPNISNSREYGIRFRSFNFLAFNGGEPLVKAIDEAKFARLEINFLPRGEKIAAGGVDLVVNNTHKMFQILPAS